MELPQGDEMDDEEKTKTTSQPQSKAFCCRSLQFSKWMAQILLNEQTIDVKMFSLFVNTTPLRTNLVIQI